MTDTRGSRIQNKVDKTSCVVVFSVNALTLWQHNLVNYPQDEYLINIIFWKSRLKSEIYKSNVSRKIKLSPFEHIFRHCFQARIRKVHFHPNLNNTSQNSDKVYNYIALNKRRFAKTTVNVCYNHISVSYMHISIVVIVQSSGPAMSQLKQR